MTPEKIGPYEIKRKLGKGGMGEVFLASDTRLGREVALKLLPDSFAGDAVSMQRFERDSDLRRSTHDVVSRFTSGCLALNTIPSPTSPCESGRMRFPVVTGLRSEMIRSRNGDSALQRRSVGGHSAALGLAIGRTRRKESQESC